jgi:hypothetical protein
MFTGYAEVGIYIPTHGESFWIEFLKRTRRAVRERLLAYGGRIHSGGSIVDMPVSSLEQVRAILAEEYPQWIVVVQDERPYQRRPGDRVHWAIIRSRSWGLETRLTRGFVKGVELFGVVRAEGEYGLTTNLPGLSDRALVEATEAAVQDRAEEVLREWMESIGGVFKDL